MQTIEKKYRIFQRRGTGVRLFLAVNKKEERNRGNLKKELLSESYVIKCELYIFEIYNTSSWKAAILLTF
jgi:hypothetical protein